MYKRKEKGTLTGMREHNEIKIHETGHGIQRSIKVQRRTVETKQRCNEVNVAL